MRTKFLIVAIILGMLACTTKNQSSISQDEKEKIAKEIELVINSISEGWVNLDVNKAFKESFSDSEEFTYIGIDGSLMNYSTFFNTAKGVFDSYEKAEHKFNEMKIHVVTNDVAIVSFNFTAAFYSTESKFAFPNCGSTLIMNKIENKWKVIHFHESIQESQFIETKIE